MSHQIAPTQQRAARKAWTLVLASLAVFMTE